MQVRRHRIHSARRWWRRFRRRLIDTIGLAFTDVAARWLRRVRRHRIDLLPNTRRLFELRGVYPLHDHYYEPLIARSGLTKIARSDRCIAAIDWREETQWRFLEHLFLTDDIAVELGALPRTRADARVRSDEPKDARYHLLNGYFGPGDAALYYGLIRSLKPRRVIESGSGHSSKLAALALERNTGNAGRLICIEPYRHPRWFGNLNIQHIKKPVEQIGPELIDGMRMNDILFIDSSHVIRPQGDVLFNVFELLPLLPAGVMVHIHDIFSPADYPNEWLVERMHFWNEQYLVEAFLMYNDAFEVIAALQYLFARDPARLTRTLPTLAERESDIDFTSMWLRKR